MGYSVRNAASKRQRLLEAQNGICALCNEPAEEPTLDHIIPRSKGGGDSMENLQVACSVCNNKKGNRWPTELPQPHSLIRLVTEENGKVVLDYDQNIAVWFTERKPVPLSNYKFVKPNDKLRKILFEKISHAETIYKRSRTCSIKSLQVDGKTVVFQYSKTKKCIKVHQEHNWKTIERKAAIRIYPECYWDWKPEDDDG